MVHVIQANYISDYKIHVIFSDKAEGVIDLFDTINQDHRAIFKALLDLEKFKKFKVAMDTIIWENGLDLSPEYLYSKING